MDGFITYVYAPLICGQEEISLEENNMDKR